MPGVRENWISPRVPSTATRGQDPDTRQHIGEDGDRVVALEGDEGGRLCQSLAEGGLDSHAERSEALGQVAQERDRGAGVAQQRRPFGELRLPGRCTDHDLGDPLVAADSLDDRDRRLGVADQEQKGGRATVDELVAHGRDVEFDDGSAAWSDVVPQDARPRGPIDTRLGCQRDSTVARAEEEVCVDLPAVGLGRGEARDPFRRLLGERVEHR